MTQLPIFTAILQFARRLRFRQLFLLTAGLFILDLLIPDLIPFVDELLLGLLTLLFAAWRKPVDKSVVTLKNEKQPPGGQ